MGERRGGGVGGVRVGLLCTMSIVTRWIWDLRARVRKRRWRGGNCDGRWVEVVDKEAVSEVGG